MQFLFDGNVYKAIKVTGPKYNMLGLILGIDGEANNVDIIALDTKNDEKIANINVSDLKEQVLLGVEEVNRQFGANFFVKQIQFVSTDAPSQTVYLELTKAILNRLIGGC